MTARNTSGVSNAGQRVARISSIKVTANKSLESITLSINDHPSDSNWDCSGKQTFQATFHPPLDFFDSSDQITLNLHYHRRIGRFSLSRKNQCINIKASGLSSPRQDRVEEGTEWRRSYDGADVVIHFSPRSIHADPKLPSTTEGVILTCPRFRILVIGKTGVGKSSLINIAFGINQAVVAHGKAGVSNINTEIIPPDNNHFVLHDSQGFEPGEEDNFEIVRNFIKSRGAMPDIKDKIHAIWLCFGIPHAGGRILETGIERFLEMETQTPIIAVFTKYDLIVSRLKMDAGAFADDVKTEADAVVQEQCIEPLRKAAGREVPNMVISTRKGYEYTVSNLVGLTHHLVKERFNIEASVVSAIAQRANPGVNIEGCIAVGRMKYWTGLASSTNFAGKTLETCLDVIHDDIIQVWNFDDPRMHLRCKELKALITNLVDDLSQNKSSDPNKTISVGMSMVGSIAGIVAALGGPAAPIVMPIAGCFVLAKWVYDVYQRSHDTLRRLMAYIVDLTLIMQNIFWLLSIHHVPVSPRLVKLACAAYKQSVVKTNVHEDIKKHVDGQNILDRLRRDNALDKIIELLNKNRINTAEMFALKEEMGQVNFHDESWTT